MQHQQVDRPFWQRVYVTVTRFSERSTPSSARHGERSLKRIGFSAPLVRQDA
jgi:hypothetical protein